MGRRAGIALAAALLVAACAPGPAMTEPPAEGSYEGSDGPGDAARLAGAGFRAVGNEPGWFIEVYADSLVFVTNYGEDRHTFPAYTEAAPEAEPFVYEAAIGGHSITVTLADEPCQDDMSGEPFDTTVTVVFDGETLRGCGRPLDDT